MRVIWRFGESSKNKVLEKIPKRLKKKKRIKKKINKKIKPLHTSLTNNRRHCRRNRKANNEKSLIKRLGFFIYMEIHFNKTFLAYCLLFVLFGGVFF